MKKMYLIHFSNFLIIANRAPHLAQSPRFMLPSILMFIIPALVSLQTGQCGLPWALTHSLSSSW
jgi:hypothetical protein